jgi:hypothetical protein
VSGIICLSKHGLQQKGRVGFGWTCAASFPLPRTLSTSSNIGFGLSLPGDKLGNAACSLTLGQDDVDLTLRQNIYAGSGDERYLDFPTKPPSSRCAKYMLLYCTLSS